MGLLKIHLNDATQKDIEEWHMGKDRFGGTENPGEVIIFHSTWPKEPAHCWRPHLKPVCWFPSAIITKCHRLGGVKQEIDSCTAPKSEVWDPGVGRLGPSWRLRRRIGSMPHFWIPWLVDASLQESWRPPFWTFFLCAPLCVWHRSCWYWAHSDSYDLISTSCIRKDTTGASPAIQWLGVGVPTAQFWWYGQKKKKKEKTLLPNKEGHILRFQEGHKICRGGGTLFIPYQQGFNLGF